jgi:hypothetical protein
MIIVQGFGTILTYTALLLQFFGVNHISMENISTKLNNETNSGK